MTNRYLLATAMVAAVASLPDVLGAQTVWEDLDRAQGLRIELHHPEFEGDRLGGLSTVLFVGGRVHTDGGFALVGDLPLAFAEDDFLDESEVAIGAPYLGVELRRPGWLIEAGLRVPIASENLASVVGNATEIVDRLGAFSTNALPVTIAGVWGGTGADGFVHRIRVGPRILIPTDGGDVELLIDYAGLIGFEGAEFGIEGGIVGWGIVTEDPDDFGSRTVHELGIQAYRRLAPDGRLGLLFRLPIDDDAQAFQDFTLGLVATIPM